MARPRKLSLDYFPHDTDAVGDEKIEAIRALYGNDGYAFYFILLERIYRSEGAALDLSRFALQTALTAKIGVTPERFDSMLKASFEIGLFDRDTFEQHQTLTSSGIQKRFSEVDASREKWRKKKADAEPIPPNDQESDVFQWENPSEDGDSEGKTPQSKGKKEKEIKTKHKYAEFVYMAKTEHQKLVDQYGPDLTTEMVSVLDNFKGSKGRTYKDDYRAILSWVVDKVLEKQKKNMPQNHLQNRNEEAMKKIREAEERERSRSAEIVSRHPEFV